MRVTGTNGKSIFLPAAGDYNGSLDYDVGVYGGYWSSSPDEIGPPDDFAYLLSFSSGSHVVALIYRYIGKTVRPVSN